MIITVTDKSGNRENITIWNNEDALDVIEEFMGSDVSRFVEQGFDYDKDLVSELASSTGVWFEELGEIVTDQYGLADLENILKDITEGKAQDIDSKDIAGYIKCLLNVVDECGKAQDHFSEIGMATVGDADALDKVWDLL